MSGARAGRFHVGSHLYDVRLADGRLEIRRDGGPPTVVPVSVEGDTVVTPDGRVRTAAVRERGVVWATGGGVTARLEPADEANGAAASVDEVRAPMTGKVVSVAVTPGTAVLAGQVLVVLTAMKMEYRLGAPRAGTVATVACREGDLVDLGQVLARLVPARTP